MIAFAIMASHVGWVRLNTLVATSINWENTKMKSKNKKKFERLCTKAINATKRI